MRLTCKPMFLHHKKKHLRNSIKSFTLIELLLGLVIFSFIGLVIYSLLASGIRLSQQFEKENEIYREMRWTVELMAREMENMVYYDFSGSGTEPKSSYRDKTAFKGTSDEISFLLDIKNHLKVVQYGLSKPTEGKVYKTIIGSVYRTNVSQTLVLQLNRKIAYLVREEENFADALQENAEQNKDFEILSTHLQEGGLKFSYGYYEKDSTTLSWRTDWDKNYLPKAVRMEFTFVWPDEDKNEKPADNPRLIHLAYDVFIPTTIDQEPVT